MNPQDLIAPSSPLGNPAPFWFITFFKIFGFILHMIPMNIWYAGMLLVAIFATFGKGYAEELSHRLARTMPIIVAMGVNLGIVPLLFTQVGYPQFYYPAGILMGWPWISVIVLLIIAYYGVYVYSLSTSKNKKSKFTIASAWTSSLLFIFIGFLFANNFSLMVNLNEWTKIFDRTNVGGAVTGLTLNTGDPTLFPRWLMMFGIAMMTTAVFIAIDAVFLRKSSTSSGYREWAGRFAFRFHSLGVVVFGAMGSWYIFGTLDKFTLDRLRDNPIMLIAFIATAISPELVWIFMAIQRKGVQKSFAILAAISQLLVLTLNAISRQWVQNTEISRYRDVSAEMVRTQWSPMIIFLVLFVIGLGVVGWMISKIVSIENSTSKAEH